MEERKTRKRRSRWAPCVNATLLPECPDVHGHLFDFQNFTPVKLSGGTPMVAAMKPVNPVPPTPHEDLSDVQAFLGVATRSANPRSSTSHATPVTRSDPPTPVVSLGRADPSAVASQPTDPERQELPAREMVESDDDTILSDSSDTISTTFSYYSSASTDSLLGHDTDSASDTTSIVTATTTTTATTTSSPVTTTTSGSVPSGVQVKQPESSKTLSVPSVEELDLMEAHQTLFDRHVALSQTHQHHELASLITTMDSSKVASLAGQGKAFRVGPITFVPASIYVVGEVKSTKSVKGRFKSTFKMKQVIDNPFFTTETTMISPCHVTETLFGFVRRKGNDSPDVYVDRMARAGLGRIVQGLVCLEGFRELQNTFDLKAVKIIGNESLISRILAAAHKVTWLHLFSMHYNEIFMNTAKFFMNFMLNQYLSLEEAQPPKPSSQNAVDFGAGTPRH
jgi:hypothetical protein